MAEKKKILYIVEAMGGGVFTYIVDLANELVNKYDMYIAYAVRKQTPKNYKDYFDKRIHLIEVKNFGRAIDPVKDIAAFFEVKKIAAEIKPDIIHLHSSKAGAIGRMAFNGKIPMFYTPHGYSFLMENYKPMKRRMFKLIESVCAKRNCTTISCSVGEHQESLKLTKHATYVNNGINMAELQDIIDKTEKVEHSFTVYTLGRICYQKNPTLFNEIAESLPDVKFVWIGDGELRDQLTSENIEAKSVREAKPRLERIETDILNNFKVLGVKAYPLNGVERLQIMYETFHQEEQQKFDFSYDRILQSGMTTKDFIAPTSFLFKSGKDFMMGDTYGATSYLNILAPELTDKVLAEFLDMDKNLVVSIHVRSVDQLKAIKLIKGKITDLDRMKIEEQKKAVRSGYDMEIIPSDLATYGGEAKKILDDLQSRNERMFLVTVLFLNFPSDCGL